MKKAVFLLVFFVMVNRALWAMPFIVAVDSKTGLIVRQAPNTKSAKLGVIPFGFFVTVIQVTGHQETLFGKTGHWMKIQWNGKEGYAFGGFLQKNEMLKDVPVIQSTAPVMWDWSGKYYGGLDCSGSTYSGYQQYFLLEEKADGRQTVSYTHDG